MQSIGTFFPTWIIPMHGKNVSKQKALAKRRIQLHPNIRKAWYIKLLVMRSEKAASPSKINIIFPLLIAECIPITNGKGNCIQERKRNGEIEV
jgi:hypothetical protein